MLFRSGVLEIIKHDELIRQYGINQIIRKGTQITFDEGNQIRAKLRYIGRLLQSVRRDTGYHYGSEEFLQPKFFDAFKRAAIAIGEENIHLSGSMGTYVKKLCLLNISQSIKTGNVARSENSKQFLELFNAEWGDTVTASALRLQQKSRLNKTFHLPTERDMKTFTDFLEQQIASEQEYTRLQKLIMTALICFNARRPSEVTHLTLADYRLSFHNTEDREEIMRRLSPEEQVISKR